MKCEATIMIPAYNAERFLPQALESASNQTFTGDYEVILINDGSTDSTPTIAEDFARTHHRMGIPKGVCLFLLP